MKNKYFSKQFYLEGLKQLKLIGTIFLILTVFFNVFLFQSDLSTNALLNINPLALATYTIIIPVMTLYLFSFLTKRNSSDFYHSIPCTKTALHISYGCSILTWTYGILFISTFINFLIGKMFGVNFDVYSAADLITSIIGFLICSLFVMASINIAQQLTGTLFTNIVVSGMIIFAPRFIITLIIDVIGTVCPYLNTDHMFFLLNNKNNLVFGTVYNVFTFNRSFSLIFKYIPGIIYTLILSLIYLSISLILCNKRKSESAGFSALNPRLQSVIRCLICLIVSMPAVNLLTNEIFVDNRYSYTSTIALFYGLALFAYFIYELLSTKKIQNLKKIFPGLLVVIGLNVLIILSVFGVKKYTTIFEPSANDIKYFSTDIVSIDDNSKYTTLIASEIRIKDKDLIKRIADALDYTVSHADTLASTYTDFYPICIKSGNTSYYRNIMMDDKLYSDINDYIYSNEDYMEKVTTLPSVSKCSFSTDSYYNGFTDKELKDIYTTFCSELKKKNVEDQLSLIYDPLGASIDYLNVDFMYNDYYTSVYLPISLAMPKTYHVYLEALYKHSQDLFKNNQFNTANDQFFYIKKITENVDELITKEISFSVYDGGSGITLSEFYDELPHCTDNPATADCYYTLSNNEHYFIFVPTDKMINIIEAIDHLSDLNN